MYRSMCDTEKSSQNSELLERNLTVLRLVGFLDVEHGDVLTVACYIAGMAFIRPRVTLIVGVLNDQCTIVIYFKKKL